VDLAVGFKLKLLGSVTAFGTAVVPLTTDGLRADVIASGGFDVAF
jgi:hypothetical protein